MREDADTAELKAELLGMNLKFPAEHWERVTGVQIIDADGWSTGVNVEGFRESCWEQPITKEEFLARASESTAQYPKHFFQHEKVTARMRAARHNANWVRR
jgi:hypothetical protein